MNNHQYLAFIDAISYKHLRTVNGHLYDFFKEVFHAHGPLQDDREWLLSLQEAAHFSMSSQLRCLFIIILINCSPVDPHHLWKAFRDNLCNDLCHHLINVFHIPEST